MDPALTEKPAPRVTLPPGDELADELDATVMMLGRLFSARHGEMCGECGLSPAQIMTLRLIGEAGPIRISDLAAHAGVKAPAASAMVDALDKRGFIRREIDAEDRRVTLVSLTAAGAAELVAAERERREHMARYLSVLSAEDITAMIRINRKLIDAMTIGHV